MNLKSMAGKDGIGWLARLVATSAVVAAASLANAQDVSFGQRLYQDKADCKFCHGPEGDGRGDPRSPGAAANLRKTVLNRPQLIEAVTCGRPATEMPHFDKYAYDDETPCFGLREKDVARISHRIRIQRR